MKILAIIAPDRQASLKVNSVWRWKDLIWPGPEVDVVTTVQVRLASLRGEAFVTTQMESNVRPRSRRNRCSRPYQNLGTAQVAVTATA
jgi:hypothetical protein